MSSSIPFSIEKLTTQLNTFNLLQSIYCMDGEFKQDEDTSFTLEILQNITSDPSLSLSFISSLPSHLRFTLCITHVHLSLDLRVSLPLKKKEEEEEKEKEKESKHFPHIHLSCPSWMNRKTYTELVAKMKERERKEREERGEEEEDGMIIMAVVDFLREYLPSCEKQTEVDKESEKTKEEDTKIVRVWYYLPSLSTKEKREDMVEYGKTYNLTGVVIAGKPGVVCVEGTSSSISSYLSFIKNVSWADIPPAHKKITERLREEEGEGGKKVERVFKDMREMTEEVYQAGMRGTRGNRGDMKELKSFLDSFGLGDRLEKVLEI